MYNKEQIKVLFILINSIIDTTVIQPTGNHMATIWQPTGNHTATKDKQRTNNENLLN